VKSREAKAGKEDFITGDRHYRDVL
jgi:hypothetical protein